MDVRAAIHSAPTCCPQPVATPAVAKSGARSAERPDIVVDLIHLLPQSDLAPLGAIPPPPRLAPMGTGFGIPTWGAWAPVAPQFMPLVADAARVDPLLGAIAWMAFSLARAVFAVVQLFRLLAGMQDQQGRHSAMLALANASGPAHPRMTGPGRDPERGRSGKEARLGRTVVAPRLQGPVVIRESAEYSAPPPVLAELPTKVQSSRSTGEE